MSLRDAFAWVELILVVGAVAWFAWLCLPELSASLGRTGIRIGVKGGPADLEPDGKDDRYADFYHQLVQLGFQPLGIVWERAHGLYEEEMAFSSEKDGCRCSLSYITGKADVVFFTALDNGADVRTANYSWEEEDTVEYISRGVPSNSLAEVLYVHGQSVSRLQRAGSMPRDCRTLEEFADLSIAYVNSPRFMLWYRKNMMFVLGVNASFAGIPTLFMGLICWLAGATMLWPALTLLGLCAYLRSTRRTYECNLQDHIVDEQQEPDLILRDRAVPSALGTASDTPPALRQSMQPQGDGRGSRVVVFLAECLRRTFLHRPLAFDLQRGWLTPGERFDLIETIACPASMANGSSPERWAWREEDRPRARACIWVVTLASQIGARGFLNFLFIGVCFLNPWVLIALDLRKPFGEQYLRIVGPYLPYGILVFVGLTGWQAWRCATRANILGCTHWAKLQRNSLGQPVCEFRFPPILGFPAFSRVKCRIAAKELVSGTWALDGAAQIWHLNGARAGEIMFIEGLAHGQVRTWYSSGQPKLEGTWDNGRKTGIWTRWSEAGETLGIVMYEDGEVVENDGDLDADPYWDHFNRYHWAYVDIGVNGPMQIQEPGSRKGPPSGEVDDATTV